jgi:hypothetical protein
MKRLAEVPPWVNTAVAASQKNGAGVVDSKYQSGLFTAVTDARFECAMEPFYQPIVHASCD